VGFLAMGLAPSDYGWQFPTCHHNSRWHWRKQHAKFPMQAALIHKTSGVA